MQATIRRGGVDDAVPLARLRWQSRDEDETSREPYESFELRFAEWLRQTLNSGDWHIAVAEDEERLVGCMYLRRVDTVPVPGVVARAWGYVTHAFVEQDYRNRGIGKRLLGPLIDEAATMGLLELHVWPSQGAISLYVRAGFRSPEAQRRAAPPDEPSYVLPMGDRLR